MGPLMCRTLAKPVMGGLIRQGAEVKSLWYTLYVQAFCQLLTARQEQVGVWFRVTLITQVTTPPPQVSTVHSKQICHVVPCQLYFTICNMLSLFYTGVCTMQQHAMGAQLNLQCAELLDAPSRWRGQAGGRGKRGGQGTEQGRGQGRGSSITAQQSRQLHTVGACLHIMICTNSAHTCTCIHNEHHNMQCTLTCK